MLNRRSFFATLFGGLLAKFLPKPKVTENLFPRGFCGVRLTSPNAFPENSLFCNLPVGHAGMHGWQSPWIAFPPDGCHQFSTYFVTRNGYVTAPSPRIDHMEPSTWGIRYSRTREDAGDWLNLKRS